MVLADGGDSRHCSSVNTTRVAASCQIVRYMSWNVNALVVVPLEVIDGHRNPE